MWIQSVAGDTNRSGKGRIIPSMVVMPKG